MTKANVKTKMSRFGTVTMCENEVDFRVTLDHHDLICICNPGPDGDVISFVTERKTSCFQRYFKTFNGAVGYLSKNGEG